MLIHLIIMPSCLHLSQPAVFFRITVIPVHMLVPEPTVIHKTIRIKMIPTILIHITIGIIKLCPYAGQAYTSVEHKGPFIVGGINQFPIPIGSNYITFTGFRNIRRRSCDRSACADRPSAATSSFRSAFASSRTAS